MAILKSTKMATQPQPLTASPIDRQAINKQNAQHSTGPRTAEGKQRVRTNALKHGLTAKDVFLAEGESARYESLLTQLLKRWQPEEEDAHDLVLALRDAIWRLNTIPVTQINLTTMTTEEHMEAYAHLSDDPAVQRCCAQAAAYRANAKLFDQLSRHEMRLERKVREIESRLRQIAEERVEDQQHEANRHPEAEAQAQASHATNIDREYLQEIAREQEAQVAAYLAAKQTQPANHAQPEAAKQTQPAADLPHQKVTGAR